MKNSYEDSYLVKNSYEDAELLIFLDWDDTVLPTTYLAQLHLGLGDAVPCEIAAVLDQYAIIAKDTIRCLRKFGRVVVVTNAETGWVELTCTKFLPGLVEEIEDLPRISARSTFEPRGYALPVEWKTEAFEELARFHFGDRTPTVLGIGDAPADRLAVHAAAGRLGVVAKSIQLRPKPDLDLLSRESRMLQVHLDAMLRYDCLDVRLTALDVAHLDSDGFC